MKRLLWLAFACTPATVLCQDVGSLLNGAVEVLQREKKLPATPGSPHYQSPVEPRGFPGLPPRDRDLPPPQGGPTEIDIDAGDATLIRAGDRLRLSGGRARVRYKGYDIYADEIEGNTRTSIFTARGNVKVVGQDAVVTGEVVTVNLDERTFRAESSSAQLRPAFVQGSVLDDLYVGGRLSFGSEQEAWAENGIFTTCNLDHPHYHLGADRVNVRPGRRIIMRKVDIEILGKRVLRIPYVSIPIDQNRQRYTPEVGQSPDEGYYAKFKIGVPTPRLDDSLIADLDLMEKLGVGLGGTFDYRNALLGGVVSAYTVFGKINTLRANNKHEQQFGRLHLRLENNYEQGNYLNAPESTIWSSTNIFRLGPSTFTFRRDSNETGGFKSINQNYTLTDDRDWNSRLRTRARLTYVDNENTFAGATNRREQLDVGFQSQYNLKQAMAALDYNRSIPVGETSGFFSPTDKTPVFSLKSDATRLFGSEFSRRFSFNTEASVGEFVTGRTGDRITRSNFDFNFNKPDHSSRRSTLSLNGRYRQGIYSDDTAQYVTGLGVNYRYRLGDRSSGDTGINVRYSFLRSYGFSPLSFDRTGKTNFLTADLNFRPIRSLLLGAGGGYDFLLEEREQIAWQTVGLRAEYDPTDWFQFRAYSSYDPVLHAFSSVRMDMVYLPGATRVIAGLRYDGLRHTWSNANLQIDGLKWGRLMMSSVLSYNGFLKKFEARHFQFTYDLHCAEAVLQIIDNPVGFRSGREISFFFRIKAFPFNSPFGSGTRGQPIGTGTGRGY